MGKNSMSEKGINLTPKQFVTWIPENHILEDVNKCVIALQEGDVDTLDRTAGAIRGRAARVIHIINAEMENYETGVYTEKVLEATKLLSETGEFCWSAEGIIEMLV